MSKKDPTNHIIFTQLPSDSKSGVWYDIGIDKKLSEKYGHVHFTCNCTSFKFSGRGGKERKCKHTLDLHLLNPKNKWVQPKTNNILGTISEIVGWELFPTPDGYINLIKRPNSNNFMGALKIILTEIMCPSIICSHVMNGEFQHNEIQTCEKCKRKFMLE